MKKAKQYPKYREGDRVILPANKREGWLEEQGIVTEVESKADMYIVQIAPDGADDDGIREVHASGMRPVTR